MILDAWQHIIDVLTPYKGVVASTCGFLGAIGAAVWGAIRQRRQNDATPSTTTGMGPRPTVTRLHADDRELIGDTRETGQELTRAIRRLCALLEDEAENRIRRRGGET